MKCTSMDVWSYTLVVDMKSLISSIWRVWFMRIRLQRKGSMHNTYACSGNIQENSSLTHTPGYGRQPPPYFNDLGLTRLITQLTNGSDLISFA